MSDSIAKEIDRLRRLTVPELVEKYQELFGREPRCKRREHLWKRCAWKLQERQCGGLSDVAKRRLEQLIAEIDLPLDERTRTVSGRLSGPEHKGTLKIGTVLTRVWHGKELQLKLTEAGYEFDDVVYSSLSAAARAATGARWNGRLFWGLTKRRRSK